MKINFQDINKVMNSNWNECINYEFDEPTNKFVNMFINEYYNKIQEGLINYPYNLQLKEKIN